MPRIPKFEERSGIIPSDPIGVDLTPTNMGKTQAAFARIGDQITQTAWDIMDKRNAADTAQDVTSRLSEDQIEFKKFEMQLQTDYQRGDGSWKGYADQVKAWADERLKKNQKEAISTDAQIEYTRRASGWFTDRAEQAFSKEREQRAIYNFNSFDQEALKHGNLQIIAPDLKQAQDSLAVLEQKINDPVTFGQEHQIKGREIAKDRVRSGFFAGLLQKEDTKAAEYGLSLLTKKRKDGEFDIANGMTPEERSNWIDRFQRQRDQKLTLEMDDLRRRVSNNEAAALQGKAKLDPEIPGMLQKMVQAKRMSASDAAHALGAIRSAEVVGGIVAEAASLPTDEAFKKLEAIAGAQEQVRKELQARFPGLKSVNETYFNEAENLRHRDMAERHVVHVLKEREADPVEFLRQNPKVALMEKLADQYGPVSKEEFYENLKARQRQLKIRNVRVTSKADTDEFGAALGASTPEAAAAHLGELQKRYGSHFNEAFSEAVADKKVDQRYLAVSFLRDPQSRIDAFNAVKNAGANDQMIKKQHGESKITEIEKRVARELKDFSQAMAVSDPSGASSQYANAFVELVSAEAKRQMLAGSSQSEAIERSKRMITDNFQTIRAGGSAVYLPKQIGNEPVRTDLIQDFMTRTKRIGGMDDLGIDLPEDKEKSKRLLAKLNREAIWVTNPQKPTHLRLVWVDGNGEQLPVEKKGGGVVERSIIALSKGVNEH